MEPDSSPMPYPSATSRAHAANGGTLLRRLARRVWGLVLVTHPLASLMYVLAVGLFAPIAASSSGRALDPFLLSRVLVAVMCAQFAIGSLNDYRDRAYDALSQPSKPLVRGLVTPRQALTLSFLASAGMLVLSFPLGPLQFILMLAIEGLGLAYDLWFKGTLVSGLLYAVYFPLIPLLAFVVFGRPAPFLAWVLPVGALLGVAMNIANSLPDMDADLAAGVRGLPHALGRARAEALAWLLPCLAVVLLGLLAWSGAVPAHGLALVLGSGAGLVTSVGAALARARVHLSRRAGQGAFYTQALGVVALAFGWLIAVAR